MNRHFESRHIQEYLNITKDQLLHWVQTRRLIKPAIEGKGRGGRSQFSFENLLNLALIKELTDFGMELHSVKAILAGIKTQRALLSDGALQEVKISRKTETPWQAFKKDRKLHEREGLWLIIEKIQNEFHWTYGSGEGGLDQIKGFLKAGDLEIGSKAKMIVNISGIVVELERMTEQNSWIKCKRSFSQ